MSVTEEAAARPASAYPRWWRHLLAGGAAVAYWALLEALRVPTPIDARHWPDLVLCVGPVLALAPWMRRLDLEPMTWLAASLVAPGAAAVVIWMVVLRSLSLPVRSWAPLAGHLARVEPIPSSLDWRLAHSERPGLREVTLGERGRRWVGLEAIASRWAPLLLVLAALAVFLPDSWAWVRVVLVLPVLVASGGSHFVRSAYVDRVRRHTR